MTNPLVLPSPAAARRAQRVAGMYYIRTIVYPQTWRQNIYQRRPPIQAAWQARRGAAQAGIVQAVTAHRPI